MSNVILDVPDWMSGIRPFPPSQCSVRWVSMIAEGPQARSTHIAVGSFLTGGPHGVSIDDQSRHAKPK